MIQVRYRLRKEERKPLEDQDPEKLRQLKLQYDYHKAIFRQEGRKLL